MNLSFSRAPSFRGRQACTPTASKRVMGSHPPQVYDTQHSLTVAAISRRGRGQMGLAVVGEAPATPARWDFFLGFAWKLSGATWESQGPLWQSIYPDWIDLNLYFTAITATWHPFRPQVEPVSPLLKEQLFPSTSLKAQAYPMQKPSLSYEVTNWQRWPSHVVMHSMLLPERAIESV